jgi:hypothetical protein
MPQIIKELFDERQIKHYLYGAWDARSIVLRRNGVQHIAKQSRNFLRRSLLHTGWNG